MDTARRENAPVVLVRPDTDLLVMLVGQAATDMNVYALFSNPMASVLYKGDSGGLSEHEATFSVCACNCVCTL